MGEDLDFTYTAYDNYVSQIKVRIKAYDKYVTEETKSYLVSWRNHW